MGVGVGWEDIYTNQWYVSPDIWEVCEIYTQACSYQGYEPTYHEPTEPGWAKGTYSLSSSFVWFLIEHRYSGPWFKTKLDWWNHCLGELKLEATD